MRQGRALTCARENGWGVGCPGGGGGRPDRETAERRRAIETGVAASGQVRGQSRLGGYLHKRGIRVE